MTYAYNALGQRESVTDSRGTTTYAYDAQGRLQQITEPDNTAGTPSYLAYCYDAAGDLASVTTPSGTTTYGYDELGRLTTVTSAEGTTSYKYDLDNNLIETDTPDGAVETRRYDSMNRLIDLEQAGPSGLIAHYQYTYDTAGNRLTETDDSGRTTTDEYDPLGRLIQESVSDPASGSYTAEYAYDLTGNRVSKTVDEKSDGTTDETITYSYDANDRLIGEDDNGVTRTFTYDKNGSELTSVASTGDHTQNTWDSEGRLTRAVVTAGGVTHTTVYGYDADNNLVSETIDGVETKYLVDTRSGISQVVEEYTPAGVVIVRNVFGLGLISENHQGQISFYHADALGSIRSLTNVSGSVTDRYLYDAYGNVLSHTGATDNPYGFAGERLDAATGLVNLRARQYSPSLGRFDSADSFTGFDAAPQSLNRFVYAMDNPVNMVDPGGHWPGFVSPMARRLLGTFVHSFLGYNYLLSGALTPRWANQWVATIIAANGGTIPPNVPADDKPDLAGLMLGGRVGEVYEIKSGEILTLGTPAYLFETDKPGKKRSAVKDLITYLGELNGNTPMPWVPGTLWPEPAIAIREWPMFFMVPGLTLATFHDYALVPGALMYDFIPNPVEQILTTMITVTAASAAAEIVLAEVIVLEEAAAFATLQTTTVQLAGMVAAYEELDAEVSFALAV